MVSYGALALGRVDIRLKMTIAAPPFPLFTPVIPAKGGIRKAADAVGSARGRDMSTRFCQNQDLRDYGIFRILLDRL